MEQITTAHIKEYIRSSKFPLTPTQSKLCIPIIKRICQKMLKGIKFEDIKTCDNLIMDGHHRYVSSKISGYPLGSVSSEKTSATKLYDWSEMEFDENDWDTESKIQYLNEQDARYNDVDIEILKRITSA